MLDKKLKSKQQKHRRHRNQLKKGRCKPGDNVVLDGAGTVGTISEISGKNAIVIFGQMKTTSKTEPPETHPQKNSDRCIGHSIIHILADRRQPRANGSLLSATR